MNENTWRIDTVAMESSRGTRLLLLEDGVEIDQGQGKVNLREYEALDFAMAILERFGPKLSKLRAENEGLRSTLIAHKIAVVG